MKPTHTIGSNTFHADYSCSFRQHVDCRRLVEVRRSVTITLPRGYCGGDVVNVTQKRFDGAEITTFTGLPKMTPIAPIPFERVDSHTIRIAVKDLVSKENMSGAPCVLIVDWCMYTAPFFVK